MTSRSHKVLFLHGLDSSKESTKFEAIDTAHKLCINVDYRNLNFKTVEKFYQDIIQKMKPDVLIGHSLGAYWALKMSKLYQLPAIIANPNLSPCFREDYPAIDEHDLDHDIPQLAYLELGDEILDMRQTMHQLESFMVVESIEGGHHRLEHPERINDLIHRLKEYF